MILDKEEGDPDSDYINANYIDVSSFNCLFLEWDTEWGLLNGLILFRDLGHFTPVINKHFRIR